MKECKKCNIEKPFEDFVKEKKCKDGVTGTCKKCDLKRIKEWRKNNKDKVRESKKKYREKETNKQKEKETNKVWYEKNKEKIATYTKNNNEIYYQKNKEKIKQKNKEYQTNNREKTNNRKLKYSKERKKIDPIYKLRCCIRDSVLKAFTRGKSQFRKNAKTETILGCTIEYFILHIEKQFKEGMTLENHGKWHLDHIHPVSLAKDENHLIELNHYTNFQPLWAQENLKKSNKIIKKEEN
jgi:hypothetical protein